jgi:hypothetical protein
MEHNDLKNRIRQIVSEEIQSILAEASDRYGRLLDPKNFDPIDPEVYVVGFGTMLRSQLRAGIVSRFKELMKSAEQAAGSDAPYRNYKSILSLVDDKSVLKQMIRAEIEIAEQLEELRTKGGRRATPIPKQM